MAQNNKNYVCHAPYLRHQKSYDIHFWYASVKGSYPLALFFFFFFHYFKILIFWVVRRVKGQKKWSRMTKNSVMPCISGTIYHIFFIYGTHVQKDKISCWFFYIFQILIFIVNSGVKGQKMTHNDKKISVTLHISGSINYMIMIFGTYV